MLAIIGGSGLTQLANLDISHREIVRTPYGEPSGPVTFGNICGQPAMFVARHGYDIVSLHRTYKEIWWGIEDIVLDLLGRYDRVLSIGSDVIITNPQHQTGQFASADAAPATADFVSNQHRQQDDKRAYKQVVSSGKCNQVINHQKVPGS